MRRGTWRQLWRATPGVQSGWLPPTEAPAQSWRRPSKSSSPWEVSVRNSSLLARSASLGTRCAKPRWVTNDRRIFFHPERFRSEGAFPAGGVLEVTEYSKSDRHEPTGKLRWRSGARLLTPQRGLRFWRSYGDSGLPKRGPEALQHPR
mmetsp:Transcript_62615/g.197709  ORF Transcript_62615/g.197709 Transcript_62615/m.197709 type:complete len:148 (-) Transcript_62615:67-510(-)